MRRILSLLYGALAYLSFLIPVGYLVGFLADVGVPKTVNREAGPLGPSLLVDVLLVLAFGIQHSVMARPWFKRGIESWVPEGLERSTYVLVSGAVLAALFWLWRPIPLVLWDVSGGPLGSLAWVGYVVGWGLAVWATFALSHFHLLGLSQAAAHARGAAHPHLELRESRLYRIVRHPMTAGLLIAFWSAPRMTLGHAVFASGMTLYCLCATILEERDLLRQFPDGYRRYRRHVPALVPILRPGLLLPRRGSFAIELTLVGALTAAPLAGARGISLRPPASETPTPSMEPGAISVGGRVRTFELFRPGGAAHPEGSRPLVLALHGTGGDGTRFRSFLGGALERAAGDRGWIVAYPNAHRGVWRECRTPPAPRSDGGAAGEGGIDVDDIAFVQALIRHLAREGGADSTRVFVVGYSGGGHMAFRLALEAPGLTTGVAVFGASPPPPGESRCQPTEGAVPVLMVNGTADLVSPFRGGQVIAPTGRPLGRVMASEAGAKYLSELGRGQAEVRLVPIPGGGHVVPGPASRFPAAAGRSVRFFHGIEEAFDFFERHGGISDGAIRSRDRERDRRSLVEAEVARRTSS